MKPRERLFENYFVWYLPCGGNGYDTEIEDKSQTDILVDFAVLSTHSRTNLLVVSGISAIGNLVDDFSATKFSNPILKIYQVPGTQ